MVKNVSRFMLVLAFSAATEARAEDGITDAQLVLGSSAAYRGNAAQLGVGQWRGFMAYFEGLNAGGGLGGRKVRVIAYDDDYEPAYCVRNTLKLLDTDRVFALFGYVGTPTIVRALPVLRQFAGTGAFMFSNLTGAQPQREPPYADLVYNIRASYREETAGLVDHLVKAGKKRIAGYFQDDAYGKSGEDGIRRALTAHGLDLVKSTTYKRGMHFTDSAEAQVRLIQESNADAVIAIGAYEGCGAFIRDARRLNFAGPIANVSFVEADALLDLLLEHQRRTGASVTGHLINSQVVPNWRDESVPLVREYRAAMDRFGAKVPDVEAANPKDAQPILRPRPYGFASLEGYVDAKLFAEIAWRAGHELTRSSFRASAETLSSVDIGLGVPIKLSAGDHQALHHVWYTVVEGDHYASITDWSAALK